MRMSLAEEDIVMRAAVAVCLGRAWIRGATVCGLALFCVLLALGHYEKAQAEYDSILSSGLMHQMHFDCLAAKYVSDSLWSRGSWRPI